MRSTPKSDQVWRVLQAFRAAGSRGLCAVDFLLPNVCDGGTPITRFGARVHDLKERGCVFRDSGWRQKSKVLVLVSCPAAFASSGRAASAEQPSNQRQDAHAPDGDAAHVGGPAADPSGDNLRLFTEEPASAVYGWERAA